MQKILLAVDGSERGFKAAKEAAELSSYFNAEVIALSVIPELSVIDRPESMFTSIESKPRNEQAAKNIYIKLEEKMKKALEEVQTLFEKQGLEIKPMIKSGGVPEIICNEAKKRRVDLIIMGKRGVGGQKEPLLGGISHKVAQHAETHVQLIE